MLYANLLFIFSKKKEAYLSEFALTLNMQELK